MCVAAFGIDCAGVLRRGLGWFAHPDFPSHKVIFSISPCRFVGDSQTLWVGNNFEGDGDGSQTPINPGRGKPGRYSLGHTGNMR